MSARRLLLPGLLLGLALLAAGCLGSSTQTYHVELARTHNLFAGSPVKVLGVEVGRVESLESPAGDEAAVATVRVDGTVDVPADVTAQLVQGTVLGERFIQLDPPYSGGERLEDGGTIPLERTRVPAEFDELLASLETFLDGLPPEEVDRFVVNVAETLAGRGEQLGQTLESTSEALEVLRANDDELVDLLSGVADLTETLRTRDQELRALLDDYAELTGTLAAERDTIDVAISETARLLVEIEDLMAQEGERLAAGTEVLTRLGRTLERNEGELARAVVGQAELYRHAERTFDRERNWLPLINHSDDLPRLIGERLANRLAGLCERAGLPECDRAEFWQDELPEGVCLEPLLPCDSDGDGGVPFAVAMDGAIERVPELEDELGRDPPEPPPDDAGSADGAGSADEASSEPGTDEGGDRSALEELLGGPLGGGR